MFINRNSIIMWIIIMESFFILTSCDTSSSTQSVEYFPRSFKILNSVEALGIIATKIHLSSSPPDNRNNATIEEDSIFLVFDGYGVGYLDITDDANNHSRIFITLLKYLSGGPTIGEYSKYIREFHIFSGEYYSSWIEKAVEKNLFNGTWNGNFENGYLTEKIIFQNGEYTIIRNNYNFYKGIYYTTEKIISFTRNKLWDGTSWIDMQEIANIEEYTLEGNKLTLMGTSSNRKESIYYKIE